MSRQTFVHERVVRSHQVRHAEIAAQLAFHEQPVFLLHGLAQVFIEFRIRIDIRHDTRQLAQRQPLSGEVVYQGQ